ncbi:MAG: universal stress protein [Gammaproteobacteria bacterium]|nr:universal stress protein [Gammaproteobacteria bacterium]
MKEVQKVIVAVDGTEGSISAAQAGARLADAMDATLTLLYVYPLVPSQLSGVMHLSKEDFDRMRDAATEEALSAVKSALGDRKPETVTLIGDPAVEILDYLDDRQDVLAVMGRRGQSKFKSLLLGSVSDKVIRHTRTPVTVVT